MQLKVTKDITDLSKHFADWLVPHIVKILTSQDRFTIALSGGSTPKKLYQLLASEAYKNKIEWSRIHFFLGDERFVPYTDDRNNGRMIFETLLGFVPVKKEQIHMMRTDMEPEASAADYEKILRSYFPDVNHTFDLVLLGLGDNAHTLSLFPGYPVIFEKAKWVESFYLKEEKIYRITLTAPVVNAAGCIAFLVSGHEKMAALYNVFTKEHNPGLYPAQIIQPFNDELYWWVDEAAASDLQ
ncbi:MAG TPA: 6-phosphogluconolactonase [Chitinophagaceae bacterium]|nr:6-phosphogluconolactonase [Chitinophagaceae bacterium]